jgi:hypothetical protein
MNERLGGNASDVQAVAAQPLTFDQGDPRAERRGSGGRDQTRRASADDHQVIDITRRRITPIGWPHMRLQPAVVIIVGGVGV